MGKKNQLIIYMGKISLSDKQRRSLHKAIHATVSSQIKDIEKLASKTGGGKSLVTAEEVINISKTATLQVEFSSTNPGNSSITAQHNDQTKTLTRSGSMRFDDVKIGDTIDLIDGDSLGSTTVTIDINAKPMQMNFAPGQHINGSFFIMP